MDNNKDSGTNFAFWIPGSALIFSLVVSTFALTHAPFLEPRPVGAQFQAESLIEARLWQDPFDALERYRKKVNNGKDEGTGTGGCDSAIYNPVAAPTAIQTPQTPVTPPAPRIMVALVEGGPYAEEVELRRRIRYAILAGFKNSHMVPQDEQHIHCLALPNPWITESKDKVQIPYEIFDGNSFDPPTDIDGHIVTGARTILFWVKQDHLEQSPLARLTTLREALLRNLYKTLDPPDDENTVLKVIGPATSSVLRDMYREESEGIAPANIEIYSPLATADSATLKKSLSTLEPNGNAPDKTTTPDPAKPKPEMKLLRTVSSDGTMARLLLEEMRLRHVDPANGVQCTKGAPLRAAIPCSTEGWQNSNRIALVSEWDSFYSRALIESFKSQVIDDAHIRKDDDDMKAVVNNWILPFSYLRGLDGHLPEDAAGSDKAANTDTSKDSKDAKLDLGALESADGNSQLDYLRRLADHIMSVDQAYRRDGDSGIGAIGVLGYDTYDKLLVLQALKSRMPNKVYFSTDLDARMLQRGQTETTRNLVLAAPYGLTLTRALQQDMPPFRESLQSAVFVAVLAAQAPQKYETKRAKFDYSKSDLLSPGIYEIGISGFIQLASKLTATGPEECAAPIGTESARGGIRPHDIMSLRCLQDPSPPPYPEPSTALRDQLNNVQSFFWARPLWIILLVVAIFLGWWSTDHQSRYYKGVPLTLYAAAGLSAVIAAEFWRVEFLWITFVLIMLAVISSELGRRVNRRNMSSTTPGGSGEMFNSSVWYTVVPIVAFVLTLFWAFQIRNTLTDNGLGEPMFLFEGISAWPTVALRLLAALICVSAIAWGWRNLRVNRLEIETDFHLGPSVGDYPVTLRGQFHSFVSSAKGDAFQKRRDALGRCLSMVLFPLSASNADWQKPDRHKLPPPLKGYVEGHRTLIFISHFWREHCVCGTFGARMVRAVLATWIFLVVTSVLFVLWPMENIPVRGNSPIWMLSWLLPTLLFQLLVFWVVDANVLLIRFIRHLSSHYAVWPKTLQDKHEEIFNVSQHPCIDDWVDIMLIAKRTAAVSRLIYAPTVVMLILIASRSSVFDNWQTPPSVIISFLLTAAVLFMSALSLRWAAEKARGAALKRIDDCLLAEPVEQSTAQSPAVNSPNYDKLQLIRSRIAGLKTGAFSRYSEEPLVRALLLSLTGIGGSAIVDALNFAKF
ncbi:MAG: rane protein [Pseudomonas sp.]|nr:rane protein [Pseudomonas sp.]